MATPGGDNDDDLLMAPTLQAVLDKTTLKWIFVGGKGGVGKTTCSCSLAIQLAAVRSSVLLISTDPAHNLSDAFGQKFTKEPTLVNGFTNLYAMEVDPTLEVDEEAQAAAASNLGPLGGLLGGSNVMQELASSIPGIDEAMSFAEMLKQAEHGNYSAVVFDTAPTGHTLRLLSMPSVIENSFGKIMALKDRFGGMISQVASMFGGGLDVDALLGSRLDTTRKAIEDVNAQFRNPDMTTFVCVCIPEFLSLYETERLVQELTKLEIDTQNIIVNQVLFDDGSHPCALCTARTKMQQKYLSQIRELYDLFHVVTLPLLPAEVRGLDDLKQFSRMLITPFSGTSAAGLPSAAAKAE